MLQFSACMLGLVPLCNKKKSACHVFEWAGLLSMLSFLSHSKLPPEFHNQAWYWYWTHVKMQSILGVVVYSASHLVKVEALVATASFIYLVFTSCFIDRAITTVPKKNKYKEKIFVVLVIRCLNWLTYARCADKMP